MCTLNHKQYLETITTYPLARAAQTVQVDRDYFKVKIKEIHDVRLITWGIDNPPVPSQSCSAR